jgi:hypothetical protein
VNETSAPLPAVLAKDVHDGSAGNKHVDNVYVLTSDRPAIVGQTWIQYEASAERENPAIYGSDGLILVSVDGQTWAQAGQWTSRDLEISQKRGDFLNTVALGNAPALSKLRVREIRIKFQYMSGADSLAIRSVTWLSKAVKE